MDFNTYNLQLGSTVSRAFYLVLGVVLVVVLGQCLRAAFSPLRKVPGPLFARFNRLWYLKLVYKGQHNIDEATLHSKYGPIVRLTPNQYSFSSVSDVKLIYEHGAKLAKSDFYTPFGVPNQQMANIFQEQSIEAHALHRRKIANLYSMTSILSYEPFVDTCMQTFFDQLNLLVHNKQKLEVSAWMQYFAFDVIGSMSVGEPFGFLNRGYDFPGIISEFHRGQSFATLIGTYAGSWFPTFAKVMSKISKRPPFRATQTYTDASLKKKQADLDMGKTAVDVIGKQDFAEKLMALESKGKITHLDLVNCIRANLAAGSDTTGISLSAVLYYLLRNPYSLAKLRKEVDDFKRNQTGSDEYITYTQAHDLPYLQATIKEALRLHPAVGMQLPRIVPEGGMTIGDHFFPAGTIVGANPWVIHRQKDIFGEDADRFRPERWIASNDEEEDRIKLMDRSFFTFGAGSRTCLGRHISMLEMQKLIPELVTRYEFDFVDGKGEWDSFNRFFVYAKYSCFVRARSRGEK